MKVDSDKLIAEAKILFCGDARPSAFIRDTDHCCECAEHEATLQSHDQDSIGLEQLGNAAWDPICFISPAGYKYYFPALIRLAINDKDKTGYLDQFLLNLSFDGLENERFKSFSEEQRQFVQNLLLEMIDGFAISEEERNWLEPLVDKALQVWGSEK